MIVLLIINKARIDKNIQKYNCFYTHALHDNLKELSYQRKTSTILEPSVAQWNYFISPGSILCVILKQGG